ncbi:MAG: hypothetical protein LBL47_04110 [Lactobacillus sp.]|jgi:hypothetical protein|nr:hypothetical protein [Lactobacillus sp.]
MDAYVFIDKPMSQIGFFISGALVRHRLEEFSKVYKAMTFPKKEANVVVKIRVEDVDNLLWFYREVVSIENSEIVVLYEEEYDLLEDNSDFLMLSQKVDIDFINDCSMNGYVVKEGEVPLFISFHRLHYNIGQWKTKVRQMIVSRGLPFGEFKKMTSI